jgi:hypothetical protein
MEYVPVLFAREGEFRALQQIYPEVREHIRPVLEAVPATGASTASQLFTGYVRRFPPGDLPLALDCGHLPGDTAVSYLRECLNHRSLTLIPTFRPSDSERFLRQVRHTQQAFGAGGCLRLSLVAPEPQRCLRLAEVLRLVGLTPEGVDLLVDVGRLRDERAVDDIVPVVADALEWAAGWPWRRVTVTSSAFPESVGPTAPFRLAKFRRHDRDLWRRILQLVRGPVPNFADHGVTPCDPPIGRARGASLRYTNGPYWYVLRSPKADTDNGLRLCKELAGSSVWPANHTDLSWGDREIRRRADGELKKSGNPAFRRAWDTSHHLAAVVRSIIRGGHP